ncbi:MAG: TIGR04282 family arsenosugar biosynthesis glycosyltransferase [Granulicella sp.]
MPYPILNTVDPDSSRSATCALAVMAKAPRPGKVKTRLCPPLTLEESAALNICFLKDTTENIARVASGGRSAGLVCYTPAGDEALFEGILPDNFSLILQRGDGFGERLLAATDDILACGFGAVCLIDSDSPTVPSTAFEQAVVELNHPGDRIVLGGSNDGGYYLIGLKLPHPEPFQNITWSTSAVLAETIAAAEAARIEVVQLPLWYDVDDSESLAILKGELLEQTPPAFAITPGYPASYSRIFLENLRATAYNS